MKYQGAQQMPVTVSESIVYSDCDISIADGHSIYIHLSKSDELRNRADRSVNYLLKCIYIRSKPAHDLWPALAHRTWIFTISHIEYLFLELLGVQRCKNSRSS